MSTSTPVRKPPNRPQGPVARLDSFKNPQPRPPPQSKKVLLKDCPNPACGAKDSGEDEDGKTICKKCGTVIMEMNMVSEVSYGLSTGGQHVVHGYHVGADQAVAKRGDVVDPKRLFDSREMTRANGHKYITQIGFALGMPAPLRDSGFNIFKLAVGGFIQGRRIKSVAAVALYIACRVQRDTNQHMLIDLADVIQVNVFTLGHIYKCLIEHLRINSHSYIVQPINPEDLIFRFCQRLEFGEETMRVANDAARIIQRMNRDWMTPGRRPAGICGAALILAARMNNFRRTVREVVYIVKVQEQTIFNRLEEFKGTESSTLTVDEFRTIDLERYADPPAYAKEKDGKKKGSRKRKHVEFDDDGDNDQPTIISSRASSAAPSNTSRHLAIPANTQQQAQIDSQNMPPPPIPIDPNLDASTQRLSEQASSPYRTVTEPATEIPIASTSSTCQPPEAESSTTKSASEPPTKRRRDRKSKSPVTPPETQPIGESGLEADITAALTDPTNIDHASALHAALESASNPPSPPATQDQPSNRPRQPIPDTEEIFDSEFADDPEVSNCLLTPEEVAIKTRIWTHENREYLRAQTAKLLKAKLDEENGTGRVIVRRIRKRKRIGDMSQYIGENGEEGTPIARTPAEAVGRMMKKRAWSSKVNYDRIVDAYTPSSSSTGSRRGSESLLGDISGKGMDTFGQVELTSPGGTTKMLGDGNGKGMEGQGERDVDDREMDEQQKELDTIAGEVEEGIDDSEEEDDGDDDPFEGQGGYESD